MMNLFSSHLKKVFSVVILLSLSNQAFAQHGSVNGPVTDGSLNPASGATSVREAIFKKIITRCYTNMFKEMLDAALNTSDPKMNRLAEDHAFEGYGYYALSIYPEYINRTPLAQELLSKPSGKYVSINLLIMDLQNEILQFSLDFFSNPIKMSVKNFPVVTFSTTKGVVYHPITGTPSGFYTDLSNFKKHYNQTNIPPVDESRIPVVVDETHKESNLEINGKLFFECVESKL